MDISSLSGLYSTTNVFAFRRDDQLEETEDTSARSGPPPGPPPGGARPPDPTALLSAIEDGEISVTENDDGTVTLSDGENEVTLNLEDMIARHEEQSERLAPYGDEGKFEALHQAMEDLIGTLVELTA